MWSGRTISELTLVEEIDGFCYDQSGLLALVRKRYVDVMRGESTLAGIDLVPLFDHESAVRRGRRSGASELTVPCNT